MTTEQLSGPCVFPGYVVGRDDDGFVYLAGRARDLIIRGGHNIDPAAIGDALLAHPEVTGSAAVGRPDVHAGEVPVAYVTLTARGAASEDDLREWAASRVPERAAAPKSVTVVAAVRDLPGIVDVEAGVEGGAIGNVLDEYTVAWRIEGER